MSDSSTRHLIRSQTVPRTIRIRISIGIRFRKRVLDTRIRIREGFRRRLCLYNHSGSSYAFSSSPSSSSETNRSKEEKKMAGPFPPGIRFVPTDQEVINCFLRRLVDGLPVTPGVIHHSDIYQTEPWNLPGKHANLYLIDPLRYHLDLQEILWTGQKAQATTTRRGIG